MNKTTKQLTINLFIFLFLNLVSSQSNMLCNLSSEYVVGTNQNSTDRLSIQIENNGDIYQFIEKLMNTVNLPMNFHVYECKNRKCRNNAFAAMNKNGTRFIIYDNNWFDQIKKDSTNIEVLTVLAHEIGHHLSAHTLALNKSNYELAINSCDRRQPEYNQKVCDTVYKTDYENYLYKQRMSELQADRFSGYIMNMYGEKLSRIHDFLKTVLIEQNDSTLTHPKLSRRLNAIEEGFKIAERAKNSNEEIDLDEIKGNPIELIVNRVEDFKKYKIIEDIRRSITWHPTKTVNKNSEYEINGYTGGGTPLDRWEQMRIYLGREIFPYRKTIDDEIEYFAAVESGIEFEYNKNINYTAYPAIHIKEGILKIIIFNSDVPKVVYKSPFDSNKLSYKEISSIFVEIYSDGLRKAIQEYEKQ